MLKLAALQSEQDPCTGPNRSKFAQSEARFTKPHKEIRDQKSDPGFKDGRSSLLRTPLRSNAGGGSKSIALGIRTILSRDIGSGYCDDFWLNEQMGVSITDATYYRDQWINVESARRFTIKLLLSGYLLDDSGAMSAQGPQGHVQISMDKAIDGFVVAAQRETKMVVLYCGSDLLTNILGLDRDGTPSPFNRLFDKSSNPVSQNFNLTFKLARAAQQMIDSEREMPQPLRIPMIEAISREVLCAVLGDFARLKSDTRSRLRARDLKRIHEAWDYLDEHFVSPPKIDALAALVGMNQTKLKQGFKEVFGITIYEHVLKQRMERASELLLTTDVTVAEVAYQVGYHYPANFTAAFKRHFNKLPRSWKQS